jgi:hypothetical protein
MNRRTMNRRTMILGTIGAAVGAATGVALPQAAAVIPKRTPTMRLAWSPKASALFRKMMQECDALKAKLEVAQQEVHESLASANKAHAEWQSRIVAIEIKWKAIVDKMEFGKDVFLVCGDA